MGEAGVTTRVGIYDRPRFPVSKPLMAFELLWPEHLLTN